MCNHSKNIRHGIQAITLLVLGLLSGFGSADEDVPVYSTIVKSYIELHSQPGRSYPVFYIAERRNR